MFKLNSLVISGKEVLPLIEGGKGISISNGLTCGSWAKREAVGTLSAVNADYYNENGEIIPQIYFSKTRKEKHRELIEYAVKGGIAQAKIAHDVSSGKGIIHVNVLWEMAGTEEILTRIFEGAKNLIHGVTCGAGMPYKLAELSAKYGVYYYPIVSSARAFRALYKRSYHKFKEFLGGVVYEDPWLAGGHNGLSNEENPLNPQHPYPRVLAIREVLRENDLTEIPIIMAGGVWWLIEWQDWINNKELGPIAFQFGTRPILTKETPVCENWKKSLLLIKRNDVKLNCYSPTGFYSSALENKFLKELKERSEKQIEYSRQASNEFSYEFKFINSSCFIKPDDMQLIENYQNLGFNCALKTPDSTLIFIKQETADSILKDQRDCVGCLTACKFSSWAQNESGTTGEIPDPRTFCIQKTLQNAAHGFDIENELMFVGHQAYRFAEDPFYENGFIPTTKQLIERIKTGY